MLRKVETTNFRIAVDTLVAGTPERIWSRTRKEGKSIRTNTSYRLGMIYSDRFRMARLGVDMGLENPSVQFLGIYMHVNEEIRKNA